MVPLHLRCRVTKSGAGGAAAGTAGEHDKIRGSNLISNSSRTKNTIFLALDIADVSAQRIGILFVLVSQTMPIKLKFWLSPDFISSTPHSLSLTTTWPLLDYTSPVMSAFLLGTEKLQPVPEVQTVLLFRTWLVLALQYTRKWLDTARVNFLDIVRINFF